MCLETMRHVQRAACLRLDSRELAKIRLSFRGFRLGVGQFYPTCMYCTYPTTGLLYLG